jgi:hypothetical protein
MAELPQILLLFDHTALLNGKPYDWLEFSQVGACYVPQVVYQEVRRVAIDPADCYQTKLAGELRRFWVESDWQMTEARATLPNVAPVISQQYGSRAKLALAIAESAYGFARQSVGRLVILVSQDRALLQRIQALNVPNLTGLPVSAVLMWNRTKRYPAVVMQHLRTMQAKSLVAYPSGLDQNSASYATVANARVVNPKVALPRSTAPQSSSQNTLWQLAFWFAVLAVMMSILGSVVQPRSLERLFKNSDFPTLPQIWLD